MDPRPPSLVEFLAPYPDAVQEVAYAARAILYDRFAPISEIFYDATQAVCLGFTYTDHERNNFINLAVYANHVSLIFPYGAQLDDPEGRLKGTGTRVHHTRLIGVEDLEDRYLTGLIEQARRRAVTPNEPLPETIIVKSMRGPKRRPTV